ncbi:TonB-dependent receptor [Pseudoduganella sp. R-32]|uniref:TonB-dependent receptor n=1 Tax=unclassified Pseudoduganella TaxID=2637179 RepID=UPI003CEAF611
MQVICRETLLGLTVMAGMIAQAYAQETVTPESNVVKVTGYRGSLETSARDKREAIGFQDSVFAEDLGKFPDTNIAESLNRIPGIQVSREISGEGLNIQIRGLGTSFTKVLLNGAPVAVASTGRTDNQNTNREVDLDMLPTDLFRKLTVNKSPTAGLLEGGAAGVVDMRSARPFDNKGRYIAANVTATENSVAKKVGNRGSVLASNTWGNTFGILGGIAWGTNKVRTEGFETIGWTNANLSAAQSSSPTRNNTGGGNWTIPSTVPAGAGNGLTTGATIDQAFLLANNPGLNITQIDNAIIPRLGRQMVESGKKDKVSIVGSLEYRPTENLQFYLDTLGGKKKNTLQRIDMNWVGRNGAMIPLNMKVDRDDCTNGCVVTSGTFANAQHFLEFRPYTEDVTLWGANPGMEWKINDKWKMDAQANITRSTFLRDSPTVMPITALGTGNTVAFDNTSGDVPTISSNIDLNNPANFQWSGGRVNLQQEKRNTETKGARANVTWGEKSFNVKAGFALDDISRRITAKDNSGAWQAAVCGNNPSVFLLGPNGAPSCNGASTPGASAAALYPGFGTGYTAGRTDTLVYNGSLIPATALQSYLQPGPGFVTLDWNKFRQDSHYDQFVATAPETGSSNTSASAGYIKEKTKGFYTEVNGEADLAGMQLRYNAGVRRVKTDQTVGAFNSIPDPRNATLTLNGSKYPNIDSFYYLDTSYSNTLPSASAALSLRKDLLLRASASRSMTRADPNALRPGINFSNPSADIGSVGNASLSPYLSDNIDVGLEWYTGREGYVSLTLFQKKINGFTVSENVTTPFRDLAAYGVTWDALTPVQQAAINARGGPDAATVVLTRQKNASGELKIQGVELGWVQPLDKLLPVRGFGFSETMTYTRQKASGEGTNGFVALGVPRLTNSFTAYYEQSGYSIRFSHNWTEGSQVSGANQNGITNAALFVNDYKQLDMSSSVDLAKVFDRDNWPTLTFDITNLSDSAQRTYFQYESAAFTRYKPGRTFSLGLRAKF